MTERPPPPGPDAPLSLEEIRGDRLAFLARMKARYGPMVRYFTEDWQAVFVSNPAAVQQVLCDGFRSFGKEGTPDLRMLKPMLGDGLLTSDGEAWRAQRHLLAPLFKRNSVEAWAPIVLRHTQAALDRWRCDPSPFEVTDTLSQLTLVIAAEALLGHDLAGDGGRFSAAVDVLNEAMGGEDAHAGAYRSYRTAGALAVVQDVVEQAIRAHRNGRGNGAQDALTLMMAARDEAGAPLADAQLVEQGVTLLLAGHETTAKALAWTLYLLSRHPGARSRLREEALALPSQPRLADLPMLPFTLATLEEAMRLYPPIWVVSRMARETVGLQGYEIPEGTLVPISPFLMHRDPAAWDEPEEFRPHRFLADTGRRPCQYIPFGAGPRQCIGRPFAVMEMHLVLASIARACDLVPISDAEVEPEALVTLRPKGGLWMRPQFHDAASGVAA
jgi:cytochrome P450